MTENPVTPEQESDGDAFYGVDVRYGVTKDLLHVVRWNPVADRWMTSEGATYRTDEVTAFPKECRTYQAALSRAKHLLQDRQASPGQNREDLLNAMSELGRKTDIHEVCEVFSTVIKRDFFRNNRSPSCQILDFLMLL